MVSITASKCVSFHASKSPICQQAYLEEISRFSFEFLSNEHSVSYRDVSVLCTEQKGKRKKECNNREKRFMDCGDICGFVALAIQYR